jgi:hypothetical protein
VKQNFRHAVMNILPVFLGRVGDCEADTHFLDHLLLHNSGGRTFNPGHQPLPSIGTIGDRPESLVSGSHFPLRTTTLIRPQMLVLHTKARVGAATPDHTTTTPGRAFGHRRIASPAVDLDRHMYPSMAQTEPTAVVTASRHPCKRLQPVLEEKGIQVNKSRSLAA